MKQTIEEIFENEEDITVEDCIEWLENNAQDSPSEEYLKSASHHLRKLEQEHIMDEMWMQDLNDQIIFDKEFFKYISEEAVGDKNTIIDTVSDNTHKWFDSYVEVTKRIGKNQELLIDFTTKCGQKLTAEWQPSENYACWQTCGMTGDDYSGYLLFQTHKDDRYFCMQYQC